MVNTLQEKKCLRRVISLFPPHSLVHARVLQVLRDRVPELQPVCFGPDHILGSSYSSRQHEYSATRERAHPAPRKDLPKPTGGALSYIVSQGAFRRVEGLVPDADVGHPPLVVGIDAGAVDCRGCELLQTLQISPVGDPVHGETFAIRDLVQVVRPSQI